MSEAANEAANKETWDTSRSVLELAGRLKAIDLKYSGRKNSEQQETRKLAVNGNLDTSNIERIFQQAAPRTEQAGNFALSLAYLQSMATSLEECEWVKALAKKLAATAVIWENMELCVEISDKMPGKQTPAWFEVISYAMGDAFLAQLAIRLPYRSWPYIEHIFISNKEVNLMTDTVLEEIRKNHVTPDMLLWIWKSKNNQELKKKYLSDAALLFKTLHQDARGNYLKAQRDLKKLLLENEDFQQQLTLDGEHNHVVELVRCIKRISLLDPSERQSLLVKIANLYPQYMSDIEEHRKGPVRVAVGRLTSNRGYNKRVADLEHLINVEIPENVKAIETARAHGDLRENSEFKYAKERQAHLGIRRREWEESLIELQVTDFKNVIIDKVALPGCTVTVRHMTSNESFTYTILGLLDGDSDNNIITYASPLGKLIVGCEKGAIITLPTGEKAEITDIKPLSEEMLKYVADEK